MADLNTTIKVGADSSTVAVGLEPGKRAVESFAKTVSDAGKAVGDIGDGGGHSAQKVEQATKSMVASLQRATAAAEAGDKSTRAYQESLARMRGVDVAVLKPYLDQLDVVKAKQAQTTAALLSGSQSIDKIGMSAAATANALRGVPAQFTDIVTSIQGGQAPLTVFLQQGGQLKDMFGGAGNAARALGGYILGLINPFTAAAAAIAVIAVAYLKGSREAEAYNKALILTGDAAGVTAGRLGLMAQAISKATGGTVGAAAEALAQLAGAGNIAIAQFEQVAAVAVQMEKTTGVAVKDTVKQFSELGKDPLDASVKLNEITRFLTLSVYAQIKALTEQGQVFEAGALAQTAYADVMADRIPKLINNLGLAESAWASVGKVAKKAWDDFLNVGRAADPVKEVSQALKSAQSRLAMLVNQAKSAKGYDRIGANADVASQETLVANLKKQADYNANIESSKGRSAAYAARQAESTQAQIAFDKEADKYLSKAVQMQQAIAAAQERFARVAQTPQNLARYTAEIEGIQKKFEEVAKKAAKPRAIAFDNFDKSVITEYARAIAELNAVQLKAASSAESLSKTQTALRAVQASPQWSAFNRQMQEQIIYSAALAQGKEDEADATKALSEAQQAIEKARNGALQAQAKELESLNDKAQKLEDEVAMYGKSKEAIEALTTARMLDQIEVLKGFSNSDDEIARIKEIIVARQRLASAGTSKDQKDEVAKAAKDAESEWKKTSDSINSTLTDALMRAFEGGKGFARAMRDTIVNMFKTMVLRPIISAVMSPISAAIGGTMGLSGAAQAAGTGSNLLSGASALAGGASAFGGSFAAGAALGTEAFGAGVTMMTSATGMTSFMAGAGQALGAIGPVGWAALAALAIVAVASGGETRSGGYYGYSFDGKTAADPFNGSTGRADATRAASSVGAIAFGGPSGGNYAAKEIKAAIDSTVTGINAALKAFGSAATVSGFQAAYETSDNNRGGALAGGTLSTGAKFGQSGNGSNYNGKMYDPTKGFNHDTKSAFTALTLELSQSIIEALQVTADIPSSIAKLIKDGLNGREVKDLSQEAVSAILGNVFKISGEVNTFNAAMTQLPFEALKNLSFDTAAGLIAAAGGFEKLDANLGGFYQNFYTAEEQRAQSITNTSAAFKALGQTMPALDDGARAAYRSMVELAAGQDLSIEANAKAYASLLALQGPMSELAPAFAAFTAGVDSVAAALERAAAAATERKGLQAQYDQLTMSSTQLLAQQRDGLYESNRALFDSINAINTETAAIKASLQSASEGATDAMGALQRAVDAQRKTVQVSRDAAASSVITITSVFDILKSSIKELYGTVDSTAQIQTAQGRAFISQAVATAQSTGKLPDSKALADAITAAKGGTAEFASQFEKDFAALTLAGDLSLMESLSKIQLTEAQQMLRIADDQLAALDGDLELARLQLDAANGINISVLSVKDAIDQLTAAILRQKTTTAQMASASAASYVSTLPADKTYNAAVATLSSERDRAVQAIYTSVLGRSADAGGLSDFSGSSLTLSQITASIESSAEAAARSISVSYQNAFNSAVNSTLGLTSTIRAFASGGMHSGGLRIVGENGPELEATGPSRIFNANQTSAMLGGNNARLESLVEGLTQEVQRLQAIVNDGNKNTRRAADAVNGNPEMPMLVQTV